MPAVIHPREAGRREARVVHVFHNVQERSDRAAPIFAIIVVLAFALWACVASRNIRLQFDELLEIWAASAPTSRQVLSFLASGVDFNPPLSHFVIRGTAGLLGTSEFAYRLPAFIGMITLLICLYRFVSQELSRTYGLLAMLTIICLPVRDYAVQARPYGIVLGLTGVVLLLFRYAVQHRPRRLAILGIAISTAALVASHYYAVLVVFVLVSTELALALKRKRLDLTLLASCAGPPMLVLFLLRESIKQQKGQLLHYFARGNLLSFNHGYELFAIDPLIYCVALILIVGVVASGMYSGKFDMPDRKRDLDWHWDTSEILAWGLLVLPLVGAVLTQFVTHAYVPRYFLVTGIGLAICLCYSTRLFSRLVPALPLILIFSLSLGFGKATMQELGRAPETLPSIADLDAEQTPLLFERPQTTPRSTTTIHL